MRGFGESHPARGLLFGTLVFFVGFGLGLRFVFGHNSWAMSIISSTIATALWAAAMAYQQGLLPRSKG